jgi:cysteine desulfurase
VLFYLGLWNTRHFTEIIQIACGYQLIKILETFLIFDKDYLMIRLEYQRICLCAHFRNKCREGLYVKSGFVCKPLIEGGGQEKGKRGGTENMPGIVGMGKAIELAVEEMQDDNARLAMLRDDLITKLLRLPNARLTGHPTKRLPGTASFTFEYIEGESLLLMLDMMGICASTGSACSSKSLEPSHVLLAMGLPHEIAHGSLRLTLSHETTKEDVDYIVECVTKVVNRLREISPLGR